MHLHACAHKDVRAHAHAHTHTHTHARTHASTHTHTHKYYSCSQPQPTGSGEKWRIYLFSRASIDKGMKLFFVRTVLTFGTLQRLCEGSSSYNCDILWLWSAAILAAFLLILLCNSTVKLSCFSFTTLLHWFTTLFSTPLFLQQFGELDTGWLIPYPSPLNSCPWHYVHCHIARLRQSGEL